MKKIFYLILMQVIILMLFAGCGRPVSEEPAGAAGAAAVHNEFSEMGEIRISCTEPPGEEYVPAAVGAAWTSGRVEDGQAEVKLRGNSSKESLKKAYTVKLEDDQPLMGMDPGRKWALVSNPFDKSLLRPAVGFYYAAELGLDYVPDSRLCKVWLNDEYMGVYTVVEPVEAGGGRVEIDADAGDFLLERNVDRYEEDKVYLESAAGLRFEFNEPDEPDEAQVQQCAALLEQAESAIFSKDHLKYEKVIDVDSFVNFYIFHELIKDVDFGQYSTRYYFKDGIMYAGPPWDLDLTMGNVSAEKDEYNYFCYNNLTESEDGNGDSTYGLWAEGCDYYYWLCRDPWFMERVGQRWKAVYSITENLVIENEKGISVIDRYMGTHATELKENFSRGGRGFITEGGDVPAEWSVDCPAHVSEWQVPAETYEGNVEYLRTWLARRIAYLNEVFSGNENAVRNHNVFREKL